MSFVDAVPEHMRMSIYRDMRDWFLHLDLANMSKPEREKITGKQDPASEAIDPQVDPSD